MRLLIGAGTPKGPPLAAKCYCVFHSEGNHGGRCFRSDGSSLGIIVVIVSADPITPQDAYSTKLVR